MVILGLGSNLPNRLDYLRDAFWRIKEIPECQIQQVSPIYISDALLPKNAPLSWNVPYLNLAVRLETSLSPHALLQKTKQIEKEMGRVPENDWGPRLIDIDLLVFDNVVQYDETCHIPHEHLHERPFALWPLADIAPEWTYPLEGPFKGKTAVEMAAKWGPRWSGQAPLHTRPIEQRIDTSIMVGIVNITPDSFSDSGKYMDPSAAHHEILRQIKAGAQVIDLGAEATGPKAAPLDPEIEWQRLEPILTRLVAERTDMLIPPKISIDTRHAFVAKKALALGVDWINDISGLSSVEMCEVVAPMSCDIVFMHHLGIPVSQSRLIPLHEDPVEYVYRFAEKRIEELNRFGILKERLIFDVGIGYGKTAEQSLALIKHIHVFKNLGVRLLVGHSRKSFLRQFTDAALRDIETMVVSLYLSKQSIDYIRVHDVEEHARAFKVSSVFSWN